MPSLHGHLKADKHESDRAETRGSIFQKLKPLLEKAEALPGKHKLTAQEIGFIGESFAEHADQSAEGNDRDSIDVSHKDGKVQVRLFTNEVNGDEGVARSGDQRVVDYINEHHAVIMKSLREMMAATHMLKEDEAKHLDFNISIGQREGDFKDGPLLEFGRRDEKGELHVTELSTIDTDRVDKIITEALLTSNTNHELPWIFGRIADGPSVKHIIQERLHVTTEMKELLDHNLFKGRQESEAEERANSKANKVRVANFHEDSADPSKLTFAFELPHGVTLASLREELATTANQLKLNAQQQQAAAGLAA